VESEHVRTMGDINLREACVLGAFAAAVLAVGIWPWPLTHLMDASVAHLISQLTATKV